MIKQIAVGGYDENFSYLVGDDNGREVAVVDPSNLPLLLEKIENGGFELKMILLTHSHFDHVGESEDLVNEYNIPVYIHKNGVDRVSFDRSNLKSVEDGGFIEIGDTRIEVLHTPGHIDDAVCYYFDGKLITGDTLFVGACGRADLPGSDVEVLYRSLQRLKGLPDETEVYPGHDYGPKSVSTIGWEKEHNKYFLCGSFEEFKKLRIG